MVSFICARRAVAVLCQPVSRLAAVRGLNASPRAAKAAVTDAAAPASEKTLLRQIAEKDPALMTEADWNTLCAPPQPSILTEGTVMKGLNVLKDGSDPVALADDQYPAWLWLLFEPKPDYSVAANRYSRSYMRHQSQMKIKTNALKKTLG